MRGHLLTLLLLAVANLLLMVAADEVYSDKVIRILKDPYLTCLGPDGSQICCKNCTSCCKEKNNCNIGDNNAGWGNIGRDNIGDFNMAKAARGDCNMVDRGFGIGSPGFDGCPGETWKHIISFCAINPYYHKCANPPVYYPAELAEILADTVHACDASIEVRSRVFRGSQKRKRRKPVIPHPNPNKKPLPDTVYA